MRRWRTVATATLILITVIYFITVKQAAISDDRSPRLPLTEGGQDESGTVTSSGFEAAKGSPNIKPQTPASIFSISRETPKSEQEITTESNHYLFV